MKRIIFLSAFLAFAVFSMAGDPPEKVRIAFQQQFGKPLGVRWTSQGEATQASFFHDGIGYQLWYGNNGDLLSAIRRYGERYLPFGIGRAVSSQYPATEIYGVAEITAAGETVYEIYLQGTEWLYTVRADAYGSVIEMGCYQKAVRYRATSKRP